MTVPDCCNRSGMVYLFYVRQRGGINDEYQNHHIQRSNKDNEYSGRHLAWSSQVRAVMLAKRQDRTTELGCYCFGVSVFTFLVRDWSKVIIPVTLVVKLDRRLSN